jgi:hypothetical protein
MEMQEIEDKKLQLEKDIINIKSQLEEANYRYLVHHQSADYGWVKKAKYALEMKKMELKELNIKYQSEKQKFKEESKTKRMQSVERTFMEIAQKHVSKELYFKILSQAMQQQGIPTRTRCSECGNLEVKFKSNRHYRYCKAEQCKRVTLEELKSSPRWCPLDKEVKCKSLQE